MAINHNKATVHIASPFDEAILILNTKLNKTYITYGRRGAEKMALQQEQDDQAGKYGEANVVSRTVSKSSHFYKNSSWDLVDAVEMEEVEIKDLKTSDLPSELKGKSTKEIEEIIKKKQKERKDIQKEIQELNNKRRAYISEQQKNSDNGLENAMISAIKSQAKKKNYNW